MSCINAMIQLFANVRGIQEELPIDSELEIVNEFTNAIHGLHMGRLPSIIELGLTESLSPLSVASAFEKLVLDIKQRISGNMIGAVERLYRVIMNDILLQTRFGQRLVLKPQYSTEFPAAIPLSLHKLDPSFQRVDLIALLDREFGLPSLFFGGRPLTKLDEE